MRCCRRATNRAGVFQRVLDWGLPEEHVSTARSPQDTLKSRDLFPSNDSSHKCEFGLHSSHLSIAFCQESCARHVVKCTHELASTCRDTTSLIRLCVSSTKSSLTTRPHAVGLSLRGGKSTHRKLKKNKTKQVCTS